jgi:anti-sigma factor RsiW
MKMKKDDITCDPALIGRFFDRELGLDEDAQVGRHLKNCPPCQKELRENEAISTLFKAGLDDQLSQIDLSDLEPRVLELIQRSGVPWWMRLGNMFVSKRFLVPATAIAMILMFFSLTRQPVTGSKCSAIINSFTGEISSLIILRTPRSHQTILWFSDDK